MWPWAEIDAGISIGAALAGCNSVEHRYLETGALQVTRGALADDAGVNANDLPCHLSLDPLGCTAPEELGR